ncbi:hypothetical protein CPB86DRAFT_783378 [Serendipita vermifera]|nr:hypothetical protein CPB86DRAFT_783378 [Serendipita vermifera]
MANTESDQSVLLLFDPLNGQPHSPRSRQTALGRKQRDPQSPVSAFFDSIDKSRNLLATVRKRKNSDLIDLGQMNSPLLSVSEVVEAPHGQQQQTDSLATPLPSSKANGERTLSSNEPTNVDPFSPQTYVAAPSFQSFASIPQLKLDKEPSTEPATGNSLISPERSRGLKSELLVSTLFTPVPADLPYLPDASLSSLRTSGNSTATRRRRSSIDLEKELAPVKIQDASFDLLRGELELGTSAELSFVSLHTDDGMKSLGSLSVDTAESPWTIRTTTAHGIYQMGTPLMAVREQREGDLLPEDIPLPDSLPSSPASSDDHNRDASIHASKIFSNRRMSYIPENASTLQFPRENTTSPYGMTSMDRRRMTHTRTTSMTSATSVGSSRSSVTQRAISPRKSMMAAKSGQDSPSRKHLSSSPMKVGATKRTSRPSMMIKKSISRISNIGPRLSIAPRTNATVNTSTKEPVASRAPRASMLPPSSAPAPTARPRTSIAPTSERPPISRPLAKAPARRQSLMPAPLAAKPATTILTPGVRANTSTQVSRPMVNNGASKTVPTTTTQQPKPRPKSVIGPKPVTPNTVAEPKATTVPARPRRSSAGAALLSRPSVADPSPVARPASNVLKRPKSFIARD